MKDRTLKSILEDPAIARIAPDAIRGWDLSKEEFYDWTLQEMADKMGWKNLEYGFTRLFQAAESGSYYYPLYSQEECTEVPSRQGTNLVYFASADPEADKRPYIFLVPGGGFVNVWSLTEGWPTARHFNEKGYHVFILTYQIGVEGSANRAMEDIARAMQVIRDQKDTFHVDPDSYITCGFSAGGYIVCLWNTKKGYAAYGIPRPQASFPIYPVTSYRMIDSENWIDKDDKEGAVRNAVGCSLQEACHSCYEIPEHVEGFPPSAIFLAAEDDLVNPNHSKKLAAALEKAGIPCRLEIGPTGGHGFADGTGMCMEGWPERAIDWYETLDRE